MLVNLKVIPTAKAGTSLATNQIAVALYLTYRFTKYQWIHTNISKWTVEKASFPCRKVSIHEYFPYRKISVSEQRNGENRKSSLEYHSNNCCRQGCPMDDKINEHKFEENKSSLKFKIYLSKECFN